MSINKRIFSFLLVLTIGFVQFPDVFCMYHKDVQTTTCEQKIISISKISEVLKKDESGEFLYLKRGMFALFDIDDTLTKINGCGSDPWAYYEGDKFVDAYKKKGLTGGEALKKGLISFDPIWTKVQNCVEMELIENDGSAQKVINTLSEKFIPVIGFTARGIKLADRTKKQLESFGFNFTNQTGVIKGDGFLFKHGILFVDPGINKGKALEGFFKKIGNWPQDILFVDDKEKNVNSIKEMCERTNISCNCFLYTARHEYEKNFNNKNDRSIRMICDLQFYNIIKYNIVLSMSDAEEIIKNYKQLVNGDDKVFIKDLIKNKGDLIRQVE